MNPIIILPAAGKGVRIGSEKPTLLTQFIDDEFLYEKQIQAIHKVYPNAHIIYITGFNCDKIDKRLKSHDCQVIHNLNYENTGNAYSLFLGLQNCKKPVYLIYGNLFFDKNIFQHLPLYNNYNEFNSKSYLVVKEEFSSNIGIGKHGLLDFGFNTKWLKIAYLSLSAINLYKNVIMEDSIKTKFIFEIFNQMIGKGFKFKNLNIPNRIVEIDCMKDIKTINGILEK